MPSEYKNNYFAIEEMETGSNPGTWGNNTNQNWESIQQAVGRAVVLDIDNLSGTGSNYTGTTLTLLLPDNTSPDSTDTNAMSRASFIEIISTNGSNNPAAVTFSICGESVSEKVDRLYYIYNNITSTAANGRPPLSVKNAGGGAVIIAHGEVKLISLTSGSPFVRDVLTSTEFTNLSVDPNASGSTGTIKVRTAVNSFKLQRRKTDETLNTVYSVMSAYGITSAAVNVAGDGYVDPPIATVIGGSKPAILKGVLTADAVSSWVVLSPGQFSVDDGSTEIISVTAPPSGTTATITTTYGELDSVDFSSSNVIIDNGQINSVSIGDTTSGPGTFSTLTSESDFTVSGNTVIGSALTDTIALNGSITTSLALDTDGTLNIGTEAKRLNSVVSKEIVLKENDSAQEAKISFYSDDLTTQRARIFVPKNESSRLYIQSSAAGFNGVRIVLDESDKSGYLYSHPNSLNTTTDKIVTPANSAYDNGLKAETLGTITKVSSESGKEFFTGTTSLPIGSGGATLIFTLTERTTVPTMFVLYLRCISADGGYTAGDVIDLSYARMFDTSAPNTYGTMPKFSINAVSGDCEAYWIGGYNTLGLPAFPRSDNGAMFAVNSTKWELLLNAWW